MEALLQDIRYGFRMLVKSPGFTAAAVIALALGIGANTAIFSVVNAVLLKPLAYRNPEKLVMVWEHNRPRARDQNVISPANFLDWKEQNNVFEDMASFFDRPVNLTGVEDPEELPAQFVSVNFFQLLGADVALGRVFSPEDGQEGSPDVVILSHGLWLRRFGSDSDIIGKTILLNGASVTVLGVMPQGFRLFVKHGSLIGKPAEIWQPFRFVPAHRVRRGRFMTAVARIKPGVTVEQAQAEMDSIARRFEEQYVDFNTGWGVNLVPLHDQLSGEIRPALLVLLGAVGFVLLIACANVANLLLARAAARQKEISLRAALGATRGRIVRQLLTESMLLAGLGGILGVIIALLGLKGLLGLAPKELLATKTVTIDYQVLGFTLIVSLLTGLIFGLVPAIQASRTDVNESLKKGGRSSSSAASASLRLRGGLVAAEVALALILLIGSGLMIRSFARLQAIYPGFNSNKLLTVRLLLPGLKYREGHQRIAFFKEALGRIRSLPGVRSAGAISFLPFAGSGAATSIVIVGRPEPPPGETPGADVRVVDPDYFQTMGIPIVKGRNFTEREATEPTHRVIINETMARTHFPDEEPLGKQVIIHMMDEPVPSEIVGVVRDIKHDSLNQEPRAMTYWPHPELAYPFMTLVVRAESDPMSLVSSVRHEIQSIDEDQPIADVRTMEQLLSESVSRSRFSMLLLTIFAAVALIVASVGIYGVMSYSVTQRIHEIGIRIALGAQIADVVRLIVGQGMLLAVIGIGAGVVGAFALTRFMENLLYSVGTTDPATFAAIVVIVALVALVSCCIPARRAARVEPAVALRCE